MKSFVAVWLAGAVCAVAAPAHAALPDAYAPIVVQPSGGPERAEFDLGPALARARREHKSLYVYLGASDCPFCRKYEAFLRSNATELVPHFAEKYIVVDLRSALRNSASRLYFRRDGSSLPYVEFLQQIGDVRTRQLVYPSVWLLDGDAKPLMQMPAGTGTFETVEEQLEILNLVQ
ncbi:MAG: thioredoxin family protein [Rubrivivax sp.]